MEETQNSKLQNEITSIKMNIKKVIRKQNVSKKELLKAKKLIKTLNSKISNLEKEVASLYQGEYQKIFLDPGLHKLSVYGGLFSLNPSNSIKN